MSSDILSNVYIWYVLGGCLALALILLKMWSAKSGVNTDAIETVLETAEVGVSNKINDLNSAPKVVEVPVIAKDIIDRDSVIYNINTQAIKIINVEGKNYEVLSDYTLIPFNSHKL